MWRTFGNPPCVRALPAVPNRSGRWATRVRTPPGPIGPLVDATYRLIAWSTRHIAWDWPACALQIAAAGGGPPGPRAGGGDLFFFYSPCSKKPGRMDRTEPYPFWLRGTVARVPVARRRVSGSNLAGSGGFSVPCSERRYFFLAVGQTTRHIAWWATSRRSPSAEGALQGPSRRRRSVFFIVPVRKNWALCVGH